jgi:hypothetical protein
MTVHPILFNIYFAIKSMKIIWAGHVALMLQEGTDTLTEVCCLKTTTDETKWKQHVQMRGNIILKRLAQGICVTVEGIFICLRMVKWLAVVHTMKNAEMIKCTK